MKYNTDKYMYGRPWAEEPVAAAAGTDDWLNLDVTPPDIRAILAEDHAKAALGPGGVSPLPGHRTLGAVPRYANDTADVAAIDSNVSGAPARAGVAGAGAGAGAGTGAGSGAGAGAAAAAAHNVFHSSHMVTPRKGRPPRSTAVTPIRGGDAAGAAGAVTV